MIKDLLVAQDDCFALLIASLRVLGNAFWTDKNDLGVKIIQQPDLISGLVHETIKQCAELAMNDLAGMPRLFVCAEEIIVFLHSVIPDYGIPQSHSNDVRSLSDSIRLNYLQNFTWQETDEYAFGFYTLNL